MLLSVSIIVKSIRLCVNVMRPLPHKLTLIAEFQRFLLILYFGLF